MSQDYKQKMDDYVNRQLLIQIIQDLRVSARDASDMNELNALKTEIKNYEALLNSITKSVNTIGEYI